MKFIILIDDVRDMCYGRWLKLEDARSFDFLYDGPFFSHDQMGQRAYIDTGRIYQVDAHGFLRCFDVYAGGHKIAPGTILTNCDGPQCVYTGFLSFSPADRSVLHVKMSVVGMSADGSWFAVLRPVRSGFFGGTRWHARIFSHAGGTVHWQHQEIYHPIRGELRGLTGRLGSQI